jgi:glyoxylase-like metal-dependent hydrolase (beta-lactamase superfamily II)
MKQISDSIYQISLAYGAVNIFIIEDVEGLTLVDTGVPGSGKKILAAVAKAGKKPQDIKRIILTHCHPDHAGSAAELKELLNIPAWAHSADAALLSQGISGRPMQPSPGIFNWIVYQAIIKKMHAIAPVQVDRELKDNEVLPIAGGIRVIHTPGHCAGHICLLAEQDNLLIAGDICSNFPMMGIAFPTAYEDKQLTLQSLRKAAALPFDKIAFGHGAAILHDANTQLAGKFA